MELQSQAQQKVLVVDDSRTAYVVLARMLKAHSLSPVHFLSAEEALEYLEKNTVQGIFLDQLMPGMSGLDALKQLKAQDNTKNIPVVMFTAKADAEYVNAISEHGALGILSKELEQERLESILVKMDLWHPSHEETKREAEISATDEKLRVWLESFLENRFSPKLGKDVKDTTEALRRDMIHYAKRMVDKIASMDKQKEVLHKVDARVDYVEKLYQLSNRKFIWLSRLYAVSLVLFVAIISWLFWQIDQSTNSERQLLAATNEIQSQFKQLDNKLVSQQQLNRDALSNPHAIRAAQQRARAINRLNYQSADGISAHLIEVSDKQNLISLLSPKNYLFQLDKSQKVSVFQGLIYYLSADCFGTGFADINPGTVIRLIDGRLVYSELEEQPQSITPLSYQDNNGVCHPNNNSVDSLMTLSENFADITGVSEQKYSRGQLTH